jgi:hypothetical protein
MKEQKNFEPQRKMRIGCRALRKIKRPRINKSDGFFRQCRT